MLITWLTVAPTEPCSSICNILASGCSLCVATASSLVFFCMSSMATSIGVRSNWTRKIKIQDLDKEKLNRTHLIFGTDLLFLDDVDASLDVREGVHGGEDGLPLVLLVELAARPPAFGEGRGVHEAPQVEVLLEVCQAVFHLVVVKVGLHESDLDIRLERSSNLSHRFKRHDNNRLLMNSQQTQLRTKSKEICIWKINYLL